MAKYDIEFLPVASSDLDEIFDYILADNLSAAERTLEKVMQSLRRLEELPLLGIPLLERSLTKFDFRMIVIDPYIAFYRFIGNKVYIYRILHGARDYQHILKNASK